MKCAEARKVLLLLAEDAPLPGGGVGSPSSAAPDGPRARRGSEVADIRAHVAICAECRQYLGEIQQTRTLLHELEPLEFSNAYLVAFTARVVQQLVPQRGLTYLVVAWFERFESAPLPILAHAVALLATACVLALRMPGVESAVRLLMGI